MSSNEIICVVEVFNKKEGVFTEDDAMLIEAITTQAIITLQGSLFGKRIKKFKKKKKKFLCCFRRNLGNQSEYPPE
jgi:hypothetical protein